MLAAGLNGCNGPSPLSGSGLTPVGQVQDGIQANPDLPQDGNLSSVSTQDIQQTIVADPSVKLSNANVKITTEAPPKPKAPVSTPVALAEGHEWIQATMAKYGVYPDAGTRFIIGPMPAGCVGADGCTGFSYYPTTGVAFDYVITIRPGQLTEYLLFHEIGHARGIRDECGADNFARSVLGPVPGHYC